MFDTIRKMTVYFDPEIDEPREDPRSIRERVKSLTDREDIAYEEVNLGQMTSDERDDLFETQVEGIEMAKPYALDNRVFTSETFGQLRPAVRIEYAGQAHIPDILPHRHEDASSSPVEVLDVLDDLEEADRPTESYFATMHPGVESTSSEARNAGGSNDKETTSDTIDASSSGILSWVRSVFG